MRRATQFAALLGVVFALTGCLQPPAAVSSGSPPSLSRSAAAPATKDFRTVVSYVEPMAERFCRQASTQANCDFLIRFDTRPGIPANAFQTVDGSGRPVLIMTKALFDEMLNADEVAFVVAHEAAHHIRNHLVRQRANTELAAITAGLAAAALGGTSEAITAAQRVGATTGRLSYSKAHEIEADTLGARIAYYAGYDPLKGIAYFERAQGPSGGFMSTHPANADRIKAVRDTMRDLLNEG